MFLGVIIPQIGTKVKHFAAFDCLIAANHMERAERASSMAPNTTRFQDFSYRH